MFDHCSIASVVSFIFIRTMFIHTQALKAGEMRDFSRFMAGYGGDGQGHGHSRRTLAAPARPTAPTASASRFTNGTGSPAGIAMVDGVAFCDPCAFATARSRFCFASTDWGSSAIALS